MFNKKTKNNKISAFIMILGMLFIDLFPLVSNAATIEVPGSLETLSESNTPQVFNKADNDPSGLKNKQPVPTVDVNFSASGAMVQGTKVTATAIPSLFNNASDPKKLYFTWYLKHPECELSDSVSGNQTRCDLDGNGKITENDWKLAAAKILISSNYDNGETKYSAADNSKYDDQLSGFKADPSPIGQWKINSGAEENDSDAPNCYVRAPKSGLIYEIRKTDPVYNNENNKSCPVGYHRACVADMKANCDVLNPEYTQAAIDASNASQAAIDAANAWNADPANVNDQQQVPAFVPIPPKTISNDFGACSVSSQKDDNSDVNCTISSENDLKNFRASISCQNQNETAACVKDSGNTEFIDTNAADPKPKLGIVFPQSLFSGDPAPDFNTNGVCSSLARPNDKGGIFASPPQFLDNSTPLISSENERCSVVKDKLVNGTKDANGNVLIAGNSTLNPVCSFKKAANLCKHLFPKVPGEITGDGIFSLSEKKFFGANPGVASTNGLVKDEEVLVGLGMDKFTWMFTPGDKVGVVVEGDSASSSEHADASYKKMWAFSKGQCEALDNMEGKSSIDAADADNNTRSFYLEGDGNLKTGFLTTEVDLDSCLKDNLLDPDEAGFSKMTVQLDYDPKNPINDPTGKGDILNISATGTNAQETNGLMYKWSVQKSRDGSTAPIDSTSWVDITNKMANMGSFSLADLEGMNKKNLAINLNLDDSLIKDGLTGDYNGVFYLRIKTKISGSAADGNQNAEGSVIVRVKQQESEIRVYPVTANNSGILSMNINNNSEICADQASKTRCYVTQNEVLGLNVANSANATFSNISWKVNSVDFSCDSGVSSQCTVGGNNLFIPILGNEGEAVDVVARAKNTVNNEVMEISRHFVITKPQVMINSLDYGAWPKLLGFYKDLNGNRFPDYSDIVFESQQGNTANLSATFYPAWKGNQAGFDWTIDGEIQYELSNKKNISIPITKAEGSSYNIGLIAKYLPGPDNQVNNLRRAMLKNWGVSPENVMEEEQSVNVQLNVLAATNLSAKQDNLTGLASLISHLPENLMFLLKIILTSGALLLLTAIVFTVMPERKELAKE